MVEYNRAWARASVASSTRVTVLNNSTATVIITITVIRRVAVVIRTSNLRLSLRPPLAITTVRHTNSNRPPAVRTEVAAVLPEMVVLVVLTIIITIT